MRTFTRGLVVLAVGGLGVVAGCGDDGETGFEVLRSYDVELQIDDDDDPYRYVAAGELPEFTVGDEVTFVVENTGQYEHDLQVQAPDGDVLGQAQPVAPGETLELTVFLGQVGVYRLNCLVDDHLTAHDMQTRFEVGPA